MSEIERLERRLGARLGHSSADVDLIAPGGVASVPIPCRRGALVGEPVRG